MLRRCLSLLVMAGLLAGTAAPTPHVHADGSVADQPRHDATPHFHRRGFDENQNQNQNVHEHAHGGRGHSHSGRGHSHSDRTPRSGRSAAPSTPCESTPCESTPCERPVDGDGGPDHDDTAVYVPASIVATVSTSRHDSAETTGQLSAPPPDGERLSDWRSVPTDSRFWRPPEELPDASDIYLTLRQLRI